MRFTTLVALTLAVLSASAMPVSNVGGTPGSLEAVNGKTAKNSLAGPNPPPAYVSRSTAPNVKEAELTVNTAEKTVKTDAGDVHARHVPGLSDAERTVGQAEHVAAAGQVHARDTTLGLLKGVGGAGKVGGGLTGPLAGDVRARDATSNLSKATSVFEELVAAAGQKSGSLRTRGVSPPGLSGAGGLVGKVESTVDQLKGGHV